MENNPKISVIMGVHNGDKYLRDSVESVLNQTFSDFEFIIIDDGSTDGSAEILQSYSDPRIRLYHQENRGLTASLNRAISLAKGRYIARQDADDISMEMRFEEQFRFLEMNPEVIIVGSSCILIDEENQQFGSWHFPISDMEIRLRILFRNSFCHPSVIFRFEAAKREGQLYDEKLLFAQDYDFWSRLIQFGKCANLNESLVKYRLHPDQICRVHPEEQESYAVSISKRNLENLGVIMKDEDLTKLRQWESKFPELINNDDVVTCKILLTVLDAFKNQGNLDIEEYKKVRRERIKQICSSIRSQNIKDMFLSGLLFDLIAGDASTFVSYFSSRVVKKWNRISKK
jgi:glycosyltransferase involved in cell wall biosynthesis